MSDVLAQPVLNLQRPNTSETVIGAPSISVTGGNDITPPIHSADRLLPLDGWRGLSILAVLACHMLPLGPKSWGLNEPAGLLGMSLFFTLSGFLITSMLLKRLDIRAFFIRRACRILPLVLLYTIAVLAALHAPLHTWLAHLFFTINYDTDQLTFLTGHLWSICVEIHFYLFIGLSCFILRRYTFYLLPILALAVTALRIRWHVYYSITTHLRVDEILAGACLALIYHNFLVAPIRKFLSFPRLQPILAILLLLSCHPLGGPLNYFRPYFAASLVGTSLCQSNRLRKFLLLRPLAYIAAISYALYIVHPLTLHGWLVSGSKPIMYAKRPLCFAITFALAHLSTYTWEKHWIAQGKRWSEDPSRSRHSTGFTAPFVNVPTKSLRAE
ncbi:MAG TPA: acyltransferase [Phycisphaerae bacterium]|nr:acyltransferase [Phycisphaerae bacterium]